MNAMSRRLLAVKWWAMMLATTGGCGEPSEAALASDGGGEPVVECDDGLFDAPAYGVGGGVGNWGGMGGDGGDGGVGGEGGAGGAGGAGATGAAGVT